MPKRKSRCTSDSTEPSIGNSWNSTTIAVHLNTTPSQSSTDQDSNENPRFQPMDALHAPIILFMLPKAINAIHHLTSIAESLKIFRTLEWPSLRKLLEDQLRLLDKLRQTLATIERIQSSAARGGSSSTQRYVAHGRERSAQQGLRFEINGTLNGTTVVAVPDTGSCFNLISEKKAASLGLLPIPGTHGGMTLPSGAKVTSPGQVRVIFSFDGEEETHTIICSILPKATRDLVLGSAFLKATKTMALRSHRLRKVLCSVTRLTLNLLGAEQDILGGYINGKECLAVPDTGSDVMAISLKHARRLGLKVHRRGRHRALVEFLDGSRVRTKGIAQAGWQFAYGEAPIRCDFYVIKGLPVDAILSNTLLDEYDVFSRYEERIGSVESLESTMSLGIYCISLVEICEQKIRSLSGSYLDDIKSDNPFTPEKVDRERARRDEIRDTISQIPDEEYRATKQYQEFLRKKLWDELRKSHLEGSLSREITPDGMSRTSARSQDGPGASRRVPPVIQADHVGARRLEEGLTVDDSNSLQVSQQPRQVFKVLRRLFR